MIVSKLNLLIEKICGLDKAIPAFGYVHFKPNGSSVAMNSKSMIVVDSVDENKLDDIKAIVNDKSNNDDAFTISANDCKMILKNISRDAKSDGLLEHVSLQKVEEGKNAVVIPNGINNFVCYVDELVHQTFPNTEAFTDKIRDAIERNGSVNISVNMKRFMSLLQVVEKLIGDSSGNSDVNITFDLKGETLSIKGTNKKTDQSFKAYMLCKTDSNKKAKKIARKRNLTQ